MSELETSWFYLERRGTVRFVATGSAQKLSKPPHVVPLTEESDNMADSVPVTGVSELVLEVVDLERAERFYADALGLPVVERWEARGAVWVMAGNRTRIGLWTPQVGLAQGRGGVHVHYALHLPDASFDAVVERLRDHGHEPQIEDFRERGRAVYVHDPDGNVVEFWTWDVARHLG